jgi:2'-5' RNA ligase
MSATEPESAIVVRVTVPRPLERLRRRWDHAARAGVPAHVTVLYPFLPAAALTPSIRRQLAAIAAAHQPFDVEFAAVGRFPGVVYADPSPAAPFLALTDAMAERFPDHPPYGGAFAEVVPHLTVVEGADAPLDSIAHELAAELPFRHRVAALEVIVEGGDGRWRRRWRIGLGLRP